jgi:thiol-disulfide isomerase/thioredoxin
MKPASVWHWLCPLSTVLFVTVFAAVTPVIAAETPVRPTVGTSLTFDLPVRFAADEKAHTLREVTGKSATVLVFMGTDCPISRRYQPEIAAFQRSYGNRGVQVALVYSNAGTKKTEALEQVQNGPMKGLPVLLDSGQKIADTVGATMTPEAVVLDTTGTLRYRGRINDLFVARGSQKTVGATTHDLRDAVDAVLAGKPVKQATVAAIGCAIERDKTTPPGAITYADTIAPILNRNCVSCHRSGEIGPMPLTNYEQAARYATNIASVTQSNLMPPWKPVAGHGDFADERRLTAEQVAAIKQWAENGAPEGDSSKTPPPPQFASDWTLGKPDLVLKMPEAWHVPASGADNYRCFVLPTGLTEDKEVVGVEYRAGNKSVVHHVIGYIDVAGAGREKDATDPGPGYTAFGGPGFMPYGEVGGWAPGNLPKFLPEGVGRKLPAGSDIIIQVHYHANGQPEQDITQVGLYFAKKPVTKPFRIIPVAVPRLDIQPGDASYTVSQTYPVPLDATIHQVTPHMHLLGKKIEMTATLPDGKVIPLIKIDDWDFKWQDSYVYKEPIHLPKGSKVTLTATYDNSTANPRNPSNPPKPVTWGEATTDEMCIGFLGFTAVNENDPLVKLYDSLRQRPGKKNADGDKVLKQAVEDLLGKNAGTP